MPAYDQKILPEKDLQDLIAFLLAGRFAANDGAQVTRRGRSARRQGLARSMLTLRSFAQPYRMRSAPDKSRPRFFALRYLASVFFSRPRHAGR